MEWMSIALFSSRANAEPIRQRLAELGFDARIRKGLKMERLWFVSPESAGVGIEVPAHQFERVKQHLLDWDAACGTLRDVVRCPECKSLRVEYPQFAHHSITTNVALGLLAQLGFVERDHYCQDCHFTWPKEGTHPRRRTHLAPYYFIDGIEQTMRSRPPAALERAERKAA